MSATPEGTRHNNSTKLLILLPLRDNSKSTFQCETPCIQNTYKCRKVSLHLKGYFAIVDLLEKYKSRI